MWGGRRNAWAPQSGNSLLSGNLSKNDVHSPGSRAESKKSKSLWHHQPSTTNLSWSVLEKGASEHMTLHETEDLRVFLAAPLCIPCLLRKLESYSFIYLFTEIYHMYVFRFPDMEKPERCGFVSDEAHFARGKAGNYTKASESYVNAEEWVEG